MQVHEHELSALAREAGINLAQPGARQGVAGQAATANDAGVA